MEKVPPAQLAAAPATPEAHPDIRQRVAAVQSLPQAQALLAELLAEREAKSSVAATEQQAVERLRESAAQQAFLLQLSDTLRPLAEPVAIHGAATRLLREHFAAGWCYYVEWDDTGTVGYVLRDNTQPGLPSMVGRHDVSDAPEFTAFLHSGRLLNVADFASFPLFNPRMVARYTGIGMHACLSAPLVKNGRLLATLTLADAAPRAWSAAAVALIGEVAERTWAALERARSEQALRHSEHRLRLAVEAAELGTWEWDVAADDVRWNARHFTMLGLEPSPAHLTASDFLRFVHADDRPEITHRLQATLAGPVAYAAEFRVVTAQGQERWMSGHGQATDRGPDGRARRMSGVMLDITARKQAEAAAQLRLRLSQQQVMFEAVLSAQEEERRRLSESLHNGLGQLLYATRLQLDRLPPDPPQPARQEAARLLGEAIRQTRTLSHELTPALLEDFGLEAALQSICRQLSSGELHWHCHVMLAEELPLPPALQLAVYRLAQELAQNVVKHAQARAAMLEVDVLPGWVMLRVEDDGGGFDPAAAAEGLGLRALRSRIVLLGGTLQLRSGVGRGTMCQVRLPLPVA